MFKLLAYRRLLAVGAFAVCAFLLASLTNSAEARSRHRGYHSHYSHSDHHAGRHDARRHRSYRRHASRAKTRYARRLARIERARHARVRNAYAALTPQIGVSNLQQNSYAALAPQDGVSTQAPQAPAIAAQAGFGSSLVAEARRYLGGNPTGRSSLWCARFMNMVLERSGLKTTGSDMASSFAHYGRRVSGPQVGAIAVMSRGRRGGHVGIVSGVDAQGNPIVVSGNHGRRVAEATYSRSRVYAYVMPN